MSTEDATPDTGASDVTARPIPAEVLAATQGARTVIAPTDEGRDDAYRRGAPPRSPSAPPSRPS